MGLYGSEHIWYICLSLPIAIGLAFLGKLIKSDKWQKLYIFFFALITVILHLSILWVDFFKNDGTVVIGRDILFPAYFCNFIMNLELIFVMELHFKNRFMNSALTFCAYGGIFGSLITLFTNAPSIHTWGYFQSALSHSTMLVTSLLFFTCGYEKVNVFNLIPVSFGLIISGLTGGFVELIYFIMGKGPVNAMYLMHGPSGFEKINGFVFALLFVIVIFAFAAIYEAIAKRKDKSKMWYRNIKDINLYLPIKK